MRTIFTILWLALGLAAYLYHDHTGGLIAHILILFVGWLCGVILFGPDYQLYAASHSDPPLKGEHNYYGKSGPTQQG